MSQTEEIEEIGDVDKNEILAGEEIITTFQNS
jgi:hypothetical protein